MKKLPLEYQMVTKTYLKSTYLPTYATAVTVVTVVTVVRIVTKLKSSNCDKTKKVKL